MHWPTDLLAFACTAYAISSESLDMPNANNIFNAMHNSMRQFGSSLIHNGMSVFLATVPNGTELYHGTSHAYRVNGTEWLAFEPEHAWMFAWAWEQESMGPLRKQPPTGGKHHGGMRLQVPLDDRNSPPDLRIGPGYLHTYRTNRDLKLLYVDGQSAAKSSKGTLDMQDYVLLPEPPSDVPDEWLPFEDLARSRSLCRVARTDWKGNIDGIIRMEAGFEMILCDFENNLDVVRIVKVKDRGDDSYEQANEWMFNYFKAIAARYTDIGGGRVVLDYDNFITMFNQPELMYYDDKGLPRVDNESQLLPALRDHIRDLALGEVETIRTNWQAITDLIVGRYAHRIAYLTSGVIVNITALQADVESTLLPFIDYDSRNSTGELQRCAYHFIPQTLDPTAHYNLAQKTVLNITTTICSTLTSALHDDDINFASAITRLRDLQSWLGWTELMKFRDCGYHEVCFLPIWPFGSKGDFEQPKCRSDILGAPADYWLDDFKLLRAEGL